MNPLASNTNAHVHVGESGSLGSILALAFASAALPAGQAMAVVDNSLNGLTVSFSGTHSLSLALPGGSTLGFLTDSFANGAVASYAIAAEIKGGMFGEQLPGRSSVDDAGVQVAFRTAANTAINWNVNGGARFSEKTRVNVVRSFRMNPVPSFPTYEPPYIPPGTTGSSIRPGPGGGRGGDAVQTNFYSHLITGPGAFTNKFLLFKFDNAGTTNYGWVEVLSATISPPNEAGISMTLGRIAYDTSGALLGAGATPIPEPASAAAAMGGAVVLGAAGLRRWRRERK